jgi:mRNA-degrading endonuclease RelE of RelBE toxin-antitoxin system
MAWSLLIVPSAIRDLEGLPEEDRKAVILDIFQLGVDPSSVDLRKLEGRNSEWRLRVGRWRVLVTLEKADGIIQVKRVLPRDKAYQ